MKPVRALAVAPAALVLAAVLIAGCARNSSPTSSVSPSNTSGERPAAAERNPQGDIPDSQVFVQYRSATGGYALEVPEGWARTETGMGVGFSDKLNGERVTVAAASAAPTVATARSNEVAALERTSRAVQVLKVENVALPAGPAVFIEYRSNSDPDPVTGKQVRLENQAYLFFKDGKLATLTVWAPQGADNVDQWQRISQSFRWVS